MGLRESSDSQIIKRAAIAHMGGARVGHINSLVSTEMDTVSPVEVHSDQVALTAPR